MRNTRTTFLCLLAIAMFAACSGGHEHGDDADDNHALDHGEADHSHGLDTHSHDDAPETEALFGDDAELLGHIGDQNRYALHVESPNRIRTDRVHGTHSLPAHGMNLIASYACSPRRDPHTDTGLTR